MPSVSIEIANVPAKHRYEVHLDGVLAGFSAYQMRAGTPETTVFTHTQVEPEYEGQGLGSALARGVLDDVRAKGGVVVPLCPFISAYIRDHPEYRDLVVS